MLEINLETDQLSDAWRNDTIGVLYELARRAPGQPVRVLTGANPLLLLQDRTRVRQVLVGNADNYTKNFGGFELLFGASRFSADGALWKQLQAVSQPFISAARPGDVVGASIHAFNGAADRLLGAGPGAVIVDAAMNQAAGEVIAEVTFGDHGLDIGQTVDDLRDVLRYGSQRSWNFGALVASEDPASRGSFDAARSRLSSAIEAALDRSGTSEEGSPLLAAISQINIEGADPVAEVAALIFAGLDTSAASLVWGLFLLANSQELQRHLRAEVRRTLVGGPLTVDSLQRLTDLAAFRDEVMRIFPPVPMLGRIAVAADDLHGVSVAPGQRLMLSVIGLHHDANTFPHPAQVQLSRYSGSRLEGAAAQSYLPFGGGKRICAGVRIANVELLSGFAILLDRLEFRLADLDPPKFEWTASLRRRGGQPLIVLPAK